MKQSGRNDPCPCGSGRKYKRCCLTRRPREQYVYVGFPEPYDGISFDSEEVYVHPPSGNWAKSGAVFSETQYERQNGREKILSSVPDAATFDIHSHLALHFDTLWAVDTNTKRIGKDVISVASVIECYPRTTSPDDLEAVYRVNGNFVFRNCPDGEAEKHAWHAVASKVIPARGYREDMRIGLVTDHDLSRHAQYNAREIPMYEGFYLPPNFTLLYATSDASANLLTWLVRRCDNDARSKLRELESEGRIVLPNGTHLTITDIPDLSAKRR